MQYKCNECNDTGSRDKSGDYLDCGHCDVAMQRKALNDWLASQYKQGAIGTVYDMDAWRIHQRALAMAPKQEAPARKPIGMVAKSSFASHKVLVATDQLDDVPLGAKLYLAAPAAANGAMPELPKPFFYYESNEDGSVEWDEGCVSQDDVYTNAEYAKENGTHGGKVYSEAQMLAILAAAGPNAAPAGLEIAAEQLAEYCENMGYHNSYVDDVRAALSGAKGN